MVPQSNCQRPLLKSAVSERRSKPPSPKRVYAAAVLGALLHVGCSGEGRDAFPSELDSNIGTAAEQMSSWNGIAFWPRNATTQRYDINVCYFGDTDATRRQRATDALNGSWESSSAVNFVFQGSCPTTPASAWMPIHLNFLGGTGRSGGVCTGGMGARLSGQQYQCQVSYTNDMENFEAVVVHEVGHGLGMRHEHGRADWPGMAAGIWSGTPPAPGTTRDAWVCDRHTSGAANDPNGGYHPQESGPFLTLVDTASIMAPWRCDVTRRDPDPLVGIGPNYWWPSNLDRLGMEMRYPFSFAPAPRGRSGFIAATQIVVRTNDTLVPAWSHRGAHDNAFTSTLWRFGASSLGGLSMPVSSLGSGTHSVRLTFTDSFSRSHDATTTVRVDNTLHTALALALPVI